MKAGYFVWMTIMVVISLASTYYFTIASVEAHVSTRTVRVYNNADASEGKTTITYIADRYFMTNNHEKRDRLMEYLTDVEVDANEFSRSSTNGKGILMADITTIQVTLFDRFVIKTIVNARQFKYY